MNKTINHAEFIINARALQDMYFNLLDFDLKDSINSGHPFYDDYQKLLTLARNPDRYNYFLLRNLYHPVQLFKKIKEHDANQFDWFKRRLLKNKNSVGFYGDKFELFIAYSLLERDIKYTKPEPPDFKIMHKNTDLYIECASAQFDFENAPNKINIFSKLKKTIISKMQKNYSNSSTALFLDITNLIHHANELSEPLTSQELINTLSEATKKAKANQMFGLVAIFYFFSSQNSKGERFYHWKSRIYSNAGTNMELYNFITENLIDSPEGEHLDFPQFH